MKRFRKEVRPVTLGNNAGASMLPSINLYTVITMTATRKTTASVIDIADVNLSESADKFERVFLLVNLYVQLFCAKQKN